MGSTDIGATKMYAQATGKDESDTSGMKYDCFPGAEVWGEAIDDLMTLDLERFFCSMETLGRFKHESTYSYKRPLPGTLIKWRLTLQ